jgi:hypothetical protein
MFMEESGSLVEIIRSLQAKCGTRPSRPRSGDRVGFAFSSRDRYPFTLQALQALEAEGGFDIVWNDGSREEAVPWLAKHCTFRNVRLVEVNYNVIGGPDIVICFGLKRLLELGYDYIGLFENDVVVRPGWFPRLMRLFEQAADDGLVCGAASVRSYESRVLEYRNGYTIDWASGAGMLLFSRPAAQIVFDNYLRPAMTKTSIREFYAETFGVKLLVSEWKDSEAGPVTLDWSYTPLLYVHGYASCGTIPALAYDLQFDPRIIMHTEYVRPEKNNAGLAHKRCLERLQKP